MIAVVLAAGVGKRMRSGTVKVLHELCGRPLVCYPVAAARAAGCREAAVVAGRQADAVAAALRAAFDPAPDVVVQREPRGTADGVRAALPWIRRRRRRGPVLLLYGDVPLVGPATLRRLAAAFRGAGARLAMVTVELADAGAYGRVVRERGRVARVVEARDATRAERAIREANAGIYLLDAGFLVRALARLRPSRATGEVYLTDLVALAAAERPVPAIQAGVEEVAGVNDRADLAAAAAALRRRTAARLMAAGVTIDDPASAWIEPGVRAGRDARIGPEVELRGATVLGAGCRVERGCVVAGSRIGPSARLLPYCVIADSVVGRGARVGPFAHLRPGTVLAPGVHVGNFVETKKARLGRGAKANHLSYLGDAEVGARVNVGAGTITCNYDGFAKHRTVIEPGAFIGSDTQLVAPVRVGRGAYVGAGTTVTRDVPPGALALTRAPQKHVAGYAARRRTRAAALRPLTLRDAR